jgi:SPP1 gp7 family putative phage head morphogenesis protein
LLEDWVSNLGRKLTAKIGQELRVSALKGEGYRKMLKRLNRVAGGDLTRAECITIARTTTQTAANEAARLVYERNSHVIKGLRWSATLDNRTCPRCSAVDGLIWYSGPSKKGRRNVDAMPDIPLHPRCRCVAIPATKSWVDILGIEQGADLDKIEQKYRPYSIRGHYKQGARVNKGKKGQVNKWMLAALRF